MINIRMVISIVLRVIGFRFFMFCIVEVIFYSEIFLRKLKVEWIFDYSIMIESRVINIKIECISCKDCVLMVLRLILFLLILIVFFGLL